MYAMRTLPGKYSALHLLVIALVWRILRRLRGLPRGVWARAQARRWLPFNEWRRRCAERRAYRRGACCGNSTRFCFHSFAGPAVPMSNIVWNGFEV
jgi:hypothetical protein